MKGLKAILRALHHGERDLAQDLLRVAERHRTDHEVHHLATDLAHWSEEHTQRLAEIGHAYGLDLAQPHGEPSTLMATLREKTAEAIGRRPEPALLLLHDLRDLHLAAAGNSVHWEMLAQAAQATKDRPLLDLIADCHPQTLRQMRWTNTLIKELSAQALTSR
jgi:hypothetical protein